MVVANFHHRGCFWLLLSNKSNSVSKIFDRSLQCFRYLLCRQKVALKALRNRRTKHEQRALADYAVQEGGKQKVKARISGSSVIFT